MREEVGTGFFDLLVSGAQSEVNSMKIKSHEMTNWSFFLLLRYGLRIPLDDSEESIEKAILSSFVLFKIKFREMWGKHFCDVEGCGQFLMSDGGMKIQRCDF